MRCREDAADAGLIKYVEGGIYPVSGAQNANIHDSKIGLLMERHPHRLVSGSCNTDHGKSRIKQALLDFHRDDMIVFDHKNSRGEKGVC